MSFGLIHSVHMYMRMESIYESMRLRNEAWLAQHSFEADPHLCAVHQDSRRCLALVAEGEWTMHEPAWSQLQALLTKQTGQWMQPHLHHTYLVVAPWQDHPFSPEQKAAFLQRFPDGLEELLPCHQYTVTFDRVLPVRTGLVLCGDTAEADINCTRDAVRQHMHALGMPQAEQYYLDILHASILRLCATTTNELTQTTTAAIQQLAYQPYASLTVHTISLVEASWSMLPGTVQTLWTSALLGSRKKNLMYISRKGET